MGFDSKKYVPKDLSMDSYKSVDVDFNAVNYENNSVESEVNNSEVESMDFSSMNSNKNTDNTNVIGAITGVGYGRMTEKEQIQQKVENAEKSTLDVIHLHSFGSKDSNPNMLAGYSGMVFSRGEVVPAHDSNNAAAVEGIDYGNMLDDGFTPQGYTFNNGYTFISGYSSGELSRIYVYDKNGNFVCNINCESEAHVGGISIDESNDILFVTDVDGKVYAYDYSQMDFDKGKSIDITDYKLEVLLNGKDVNINHDVGNSSTLYACDGKLYITNFDDGTYSQVSEVNYEYKKSTSVNETGRIELEVVNPNDDLPDEYKKTLQGIPGVQGIAKYKNDSGKEYFVFSSSYGWYDSRIAIYERDGDDLKRVSYKYYDTPYMEGIYIDDKGDIYTMYEKGRILPNHETEKIGNVNDIAAEKGKPDAYKEKKFEDIGKEYGDKFREKHGYK